MDQKQPETKANQKAASSENEGKEAKHNALVSFAQRTGTGTHNALNSIAKSAASKAFVLLIAGLVVGILFGQLAMPNMGIGLLSLPAAGGASQTVDTAALKEKVESYLNENVLKPQGVEGKIISITPYNDDFYTVKIEILQDGNSLATQDIYLTKSGNAISGTVIFLDKPVEKPAEQPAQPEQPAGVPKSDKPVVELFVMSYCPYGLQAQKALLSAWELLKGKADISVKFVYYAMHDWKEIEENTRQYCIQKEQSAKYIAYLNCFTASGDATACLASTGIDKAKLDTCTAAADKEFGIKAVYDDKASWLSGQFPQYNVDKELNEQYGVGGSPTLVINGVQTNVNRSPEAIKQAICNAFNEAPAECSTTLDSTAASAGFGGGTGTASTGGCST